MNAGPQNAQPWNNINKYIGIESTSNSGIEWKRIFHGSASNGNSMVLEQGNHGGNKKICK